MKVRNLIKKLLKMDMDASVLWYDGDRCAGVRFVEQNRDDAGMFVLVGALPNDHYEEKDRPPQAP